MGVSPGDPWTRPQRGIGGDGLNGQGNGEAKIDGGYSDETPVSAVGQVGVGADKIPELPPPPDEGADGEGWRQGFRMSV